jgi:hypothetical protein
MSEHLSTETVPSPGHWAMDTECGEVGKVLAVNDLFVLLEPVAGGQPWQAAPISIRPATMTERMLSGVRKANEQTSRSLK